MYVSTSEIVQKANSIVAQCGTRDPLRIARDLGIEVMYYPFNEQRGAYKVLMRNRFIFIKNDLHPVMENIVLLHELGHDALHREEATKVGGFKEFEIFNMRDNRMEYEANLFAAQISLMQLIMSPSAAVIKISIPTSGETNGIGFCHFAGRGSGKGGNTAAENGCEADQQRHKP